MRDRYGNEIDTPSIDPYGGQGAFRGARGWVKQAGRVPAVSASSGLNQAQINAAPVDWRGTFNKTSVPAPAPPPATPPSDTQQFRNQFAANGQPARSSIPPVVAPRINPLATTPAPASPLPPPASGEQPNLTPVPVKYGTVAPAHTWQQNITSQYPAIGQPGTPANKAFVAAFQQHNDPSKAMETAQQVMAQHDEQGQPLPGLVNERQPNRIDPYALN